MPDAVYVVSDVVKNLPSVVQDAANAVADVVAHVANASTNSFAASVKGVVDVVKDAAIVYPMPAHL